MSQTQGDGRGSPAGPTGSDLVGLGFALAASVLLPLFAGIGLDALLHVSPLGLLAGLAVGVAVACFVVYQRFKPYLT